MSNSPYRGDVCSHTHSFALDNVIRRIFQNPGRIVGEYISQGDIVVDLGCGPGFFSVEMARMVGAGGKVIAVDLQKEMLEKLDRKSGKKGVKDRIIPHLCSQDSIGIDEKVSADFILAFYMVHETPDQYQFLSQVKPLLKADGRFLLVEPFFHVSRQKFLRTEEIAAKAGFKVIDRPKRKGGRSLLLQ